MPATIRKATKTDHIKLVELLKEAKLPTEDLETVQVTFHVVESDQQLLGCLGMETFGTMALLRSFAVIDEFRNAGLGSLLLDEVMVWSKQQGLSSIYLLTTTAAAFFSKKGFESIQRTDAPLAIQQTSEFSSICPASATLMKLSLNVNL